MFVYREMPPDVQAVIEPFLEPYAWLVPRWCQRVFVRYIGDSPQVSDANSGVAADIIVERDYRWGSVRIYGGWMEEPDDERRLDLIHELVHLSVNPLVDFFRGILGREVADEKLRDYLKGILREKSEAAVQDIAERIYVHERTLLSGEASNGHQATDANGDLDGPPGTTVTGAEHPAARTSSRASKVVRSGPRRRHL